MINFTLYNYTFKNIKLTNKLYKNKNEVDKLNNLDYNKNKFAIIKRNDCRICGLFSYYIVYLGCINKYIISGFIPIIDLESFPNIFNKLNASLISKNPWEIFFNQPFGYTLNDVKKNAKKIQFFVCNYVPYRPKENLF